jgi:succinylglutamate desuccinylase
MSTFVNKTPSNIHTHLFQATYAKIKKNHIRKSTSSIMTDEVIEKKGPQPGPINMVIVGTHGNEMCGVQVLEELLPTLQIESGTVYFAYGNPRAIEENVRFVEKNLNRMYKPKNELTDEEKNSYEYNRAIYLQEYLNRSESVLDIHASTNPKSRPFIICEKNAECIYPSLPVDTVVYGFDENEPGGTDYYMNRIGKIGICVECGYLGDEASSVKARESILQFLSLHGHITYPRTTEKTPKRFQIHTLYLTKTNHFRLRKEFSDFQVVAQGEEIGVDGEEAVTCDRDSIILFPHNADKIGQEVFLLGESI